MTASRGEIAMRIWNILAAAGIAATLSFAPVVSAQARHVSHRAQAPEDGALRVAPPAPLAAERGARPFADAVWTDGFWRWDGAVFTWVQGAWVHAVPGHRWSPYRWTQQADGQWILIPGGWIPTHESRL
jgi:hypothetical protein